MGEILLTIGGALIGALLSWPISHWYYRKSAKEVPDWAVKTPSWAIPLIESLPAHPLTVEELGTLYAKALERVEPDPDSGFRVCPNCGASSAEFSKNYHTYNRSPSDDEQPSHFRKYFGLTRYTINCRRCGHLLKEATENDPGYF